MEWQAVVDSLDGQYKPLTEGTEKDQKLTCQINRLRAQIWIPDLPKTNTVKVKVVSMHSMKEWKFISQHSYHLGTRCRCVVRFTPWPLYRRRKSQRYPLNRRLGVLQSRAQRFGKERNLFPLPKAGPRHIGATGRLIIWRPLKPTLFRLPRPRTGMATLFEHECPNCGKFWEKWFLFPMGILISK
jgi:hypothetical protein